MNIGKFEENVRKIQKVGSQLATKVVFIEIAKPAHFLIDNCGDFSDVVDNYNTVLKKISKEGYLCVFGDVQMDKLLLPDGHHLTKDGHKKIADKILDLTVTSGVDYS